MTDPVAPLSLPYSPEALTRAWRLALETELGLIITLSPDDATLATARAELYAARRALMAAEPDAPYDDFYVALPKDTNMILIVRKPTTGGLE